MHNAHAKRPEGVLWIFLALVIQGALVAQPESGDAETRLQRYETIVRRNPRPGAAFDAWMRLLVDGGRAEERAASLEGEVREHPKDAARWILLGLVQERLGNVQRAIGAYTEAGKLSPDAHEPLLFQGFALESLRQLDAAAATLTAALERPMPRAVYLEAAKRCVRIQVRRGAGPKAERLLADMEKLLPLGSELHQEIAQIYADEGDDARARVHWQHVIEKSSDPFQRAQAHIEIAQRLFEGNRGPEALDRLQTLLGTLEPDSWLAKDVQRRLERVLRNTGGFEAVLGWYEERLEASPQDVQALIGVARALAREGKHREAIERYAALIAAAPARRDAREAHVSLLLRVSQVDAAIAACEEITQRFPGDPTSWEFLGATALKKTDKHGEPTPDAVARATWAWTKLSELSPSDPALALHAARLCQAELTRTQQWASSSDATPSPLLATGESLFREAISRDPERADAREAFGEFWWALDRKDQAKEAWRDIAAPPRKTAANFSRVSEILRRHGELAEAKDHAKEALGREDSNKTYHLQLIQILSELELWDEALTRLDTLESRTEDLEELERLLRLRVGIFKESNALASALAGTAGNHSATSSVRDLWFQGLLYEELGQMKPAAACLERAAARSNGALLLLRHQAQLLEFGGDLDAALDVYRNLIRTDPQKEVEYLVKSATIELARGKVKPAATLGNRMLELAPGRPDVHRLVAEIARRDRRLEVAIQHLRRASELDPSSFELRMELIAFLEKFGQREVATEESWKALDDATRDEDRRTIVLTLVRLHPKNTSLDPLIARVKRLRRADEDPRSLTLVLVRLLKESKRPAEALDELTTLLERTGDEVTLLREATAISVELKNWKLAANLQERVVRLDPETRELELLAIYYVRCGKRDEALATWGRIVLVTGDRAEPLKLVDTEAAAGRLDDALGIAELALAQSPTDWRLWWRTATIHLRQKHVTDARIQFERLIALPHITSLNATPTSPSSAMQLASHRIKHLPEDIAVLPEVSEILELREQLLALNAMEPQRIPPKSSRTQGRTRSRPRGVLPRWPVPRTHRQAIALSIQALESMAQVENRRDAWRKFLNDAQARNDAIPRAIAMREAALGSSQTPYLDGLEISTPEDPLPHWVRLLNLPAAIGSFTSPAERHRIRSTVRHSLDWFKNRQPGQLRYAVRLACNRWRLLGFPSDAIAAFKDYVHVAKTVEEFEGFPDLATALGDQDCVGRLLDRMSELASTAPPSLKTWEVLRSAQGIIEQGRGQRFQAGLRIFFAILDTEQTLRQQGVTKFPPAGRLRLPAFPRPSVYLSSHALAALHSTHAHELQDSQGSEFLRQLDEHIALSPPSKATTLGVAKAACLWWSHRRTSALQLMADLCERHPDEGWLALLHAQALSLDRRPRRAWEIVERLRPTGALEAASILEARSEVEAELLNLGPEGALLVLEGELNVPGQPALEAFFGQPVPRGTTPSRPSAVSRSRTDIRTALGYAQDRGLLVPLLAKARAKWDTPGGSPHLGAMVVLGSLLASEREQAHEAFARWCREFGNREAPLSPDGTWWLIGACLAEPMLSELATDVAKTMLESKSYRKQWKWVKEISLTLLASLTARGAIEEGEALVQSLPNIALDGISTRGTAESRHAHCMSYLAHLTQAFEPPFTAAYMEALVTVAPRLPSAYVTAFTRHVETVFTRLEAPIDPKARIRIAKALVDILFANGIDKVPVYYRPSIMISGEPVAPLPNLLVTLLGPSQELVAARKVWDRHPNANSQEMVVLRYFAAKVLGDEEAAASLRALLLPAPQ